MKSTIQMLGFAASAAALTTSPLATSNGCYYNVAGVGNFNYMMNSSSDLSSSIYTVATNNAPFARRFDLTNIGYNTANSAMTLTVPGGQTTGPISSAQLVTSFSDILYGSVRTVAKISSIPGTTHGFTFYANDSQEVDFAFITGDSTVVHLTNEQTSSSSAATTYQYAAPLDATAAFHEYRVDWLPTKTMFYIDGTLIQTITGNVPSTAGFWVWNNWSNGNTWAAGPPLADNVLQIQSISGYFNRTSVATNIANGAACAAVKSSSSSSSSVVSSTSSAVSSASAAAKIVSTSSAPVSSSTSSVASSSTVKSTATLSSAAIAATVSASVGSATVSTALTVPVGTTTLCPAYNGYNYSDPTTGDVFTIGCTSDFSGANLGMVWVSGLATCIQSCASTSKCVAVALSGAACYMKTAVGTASTNLGVQGAYMSS